MASWMIHLRIADTLLKQIPNLSKEEFIMGNIAPDSGVPNEDWSKFTPSTTVSHFRTDNGAGKKKVNIGAFVGRYFMPEQRRSYDSKAYSFFLGYLTHLLTDCLWSRQIAHPSMDKYSAYNNREMVSKIKDDWYDLDYLYLREHPGFDAFQTYKNIDAFPNVYMDIFSRDAFDDRRAYIMGFYEQENDHLDREYPYLTKEEADRFVLEASAAILGELKQYQTKRDQI